MSLNLTRINRYPKNFSLVTSDGRAFSTEEYKGKWLYLVFHRHLSCLPCRAHLLKLRQQQERIAQNDIEVMVVTFEDAEQALNYQRDTQLHWPVVVDRTRELYSYYGMSKAGFWDLWGPASWWAYLREILKGNMPKYSKGDIHQRGGDILLDPKGMVVLHRVGKGPADRPAVEDILQIVERENKTKMKPEELQKLKN